MEKLVLVCAPYGTRAHLGAIHKARVDKKITSAASILKRDALLGSLSGIRTQWLITL
jgi:hypothetical protein